jgi:hypothetical protein
VFKTPEEVAQKILDDFKKRVDVKVVEINDEEIK